MCSIMRKCIFSITLLLFCSLARGQGNYEYSYWIDGDVSNRIVISSDNITENLQVDASRLNDGLHFLHVQVKDKEGGLTPPIKRMFLKARLIDVSDSAYYQVDDNEDVFDIKSVETSQSIDVSNLNEGLHSIRYMLRNSDGHVASSALRNFYRISPLIEYLNCMCYIDGTLYKNDKINPQQSIVEWDIDVNEISRGLHQLQVQVVTPSGAASSLYNALFVRTITDEELSGLRCFYIIDDSLTHIVEGTYEDQGYHFELDVTELPDGEHRITYMLVDDKEVVTDMRSATFIKESDGEGISILINDKEETLLYDISGRRVTGPLTRGVYIINGRRVLIK